MSRYLSPGLLAVGLGLAATACSEPNLNTNLRPAGPPDVLAVLTQNPLDLTESAVKCKYVAGKRDPKGPGFVGNPLDGGSMICPEAEADFHAATLEPRNPDGLGWALRVMFDELLDGDRVETLVCNPDTGLCAGSLDDTHPVVLKCGTANTTVGYTGYYVPNGNSVTFPVGPSLYVLPNPDELTFPTGSACTLTLDPTRITDKDGNPSPDADLTVGLKIADLALIGIDPAEGDAATISPDPVAAGAVAFIFNANLDENETDPAAFQLKDGAGANVDTAIFVGAYNSASLSDAVYVFPDTATGIFLPGDYTATMKPTTLTEINGGTLVTTADQVTHFSVAFAKTGQTSGTDLAANGIIRISFNNTIDPASVIPAQFEMFQTNPVTSPPNAPIAFTVAVGNTSTASLNNIVNNALVFTPAAELPIGTYAVRIKAGTIIKDIAGTPHEAKFNAPLAFTYNVLLKSTHTVPTTIATTLLGASANFEVVFSGTLDAATVTDADFALIDTSAAGAAVPFTLDPLKQSVSRPAPAPPSHPNDTVVINPTANLTVGHVYELTIKQGAVIKSLNGVSRTFAAPSTSSTNRTKWTFTAN